MSRAKAKSAREEHEYYPTPRWAIRRYVEKAAPFMPGGLWLEPSVGCGRIPSVVAEFANVEWATCDIDRRHRADFHDDFIKPDIIFPAGYFDHVMTNPPFSLAMQFACRGLVIGRAVSLLLRLGFLETRERRDFIDHTKPHLWPFPQRPGFHGTGNDMASYAWFSWGIGEPGGYTMLENTSRKEKKLG